MNLASILILSAVLAAAVAALVRIITGKRRSCCDSCHSSCDGCALRESCSGGGSCPDAKPRT